MMVMKKKSQDTTQKDKTKKPKPDSISKIKDDMKHQKKALKKIIKNYTK